MYIYVYVLLLQIEVFGTNNLTAEIASESEYSKIFIFGLYDIIKFNRVYVTLFKLSSVLLIITVTIQVCIEMTHLN